ncbi:MAG: hypothetical protein PHP46_01065 [Candidatus Omnitrophica bacterium]|nr:hypothetical protein [Candidatus Omnitrophota bacterium]
MKASMKAVFFVMILCASMAAISQDLGARCGPVHGSYYIPEPRLIQPTTELVDLSGKSQLKFEWSPHEGDRSKRKYYDFRLYQGEQMLEAGLVFKKRVDPDTAVISLDAGLFKDGQAYTWSLRQVYDTQGKSRRSFYTFQVVKK